jgi:hypothetical protein
MQQAYNNIENRHFLEILEQQRKDDLRNILSTESGIRVFAWMLNNMGLFKPAFATNSNIYRNAALNDFARALTEEIDQADMQFLIKIKQNMLRLKDEYVKRGLVLKGD